MTHVLEEIQQEIKKQARKIAARHGLNKAEDGLAQAKSFDSQQKHAIMQIADTDGFKIILQHEKDIIDACNSLMSCKGIPDDVLRQTQIEYAVAAEKYLFLKTLADPNKR